MSNLIKPDLIQCQSEKPNGATAMSLGGVPEMVRCTSKPTVVIIEKQPGKGGQIGSMSLCSDCLNVAKEQLPENYFNIKSIKPNERKNN